MRENIERKKKEKIRKEKITKVLKELIVTMNIF